MSPQIPTSKANIYVNLQKQQAYTQINIMENCVALYVQTHFIKLVARRRNRSKNLLEGSVTSTTQIKMVADIAQAKRRDRLSQSAAF